MNPNKSKDRIDARYLKLLNRLETYPSALQELFPVTTSEIKKNLTRIDDSKTVNPLKIEFRKNIQRIVVQGNFEIMIYEWFYDGNYRSGNEAIGYTAEKSILKGYSNTDEIKLGVHLGIEMEKPDLIGNVVDCGGINIDPFMTPWYEELSPLFEIIERRLYNEKQDIKLVNDFFEVMLVCNHLFELKMFQIFQQTYNNIEIEKPKYFFIHRHERWPVLIS